MQNWTTCLCPRRHRAPGKGPFYVGKEYALIARQTEEQVVCRIDHYQTQPKVFVSVFAKQVDKERSTVNFDTDKVKPLHLKTLNNADFDGLAAFRPLSSSDEAFYQDD